jgi:hypothetical protein
VIEESGGFVIVQSRMAVDVQFEAGGMRRREDVVGSVVVN